MQKENAVRVAALSRRPHTPQSSKLASSDGLVGRPPMIDISNKLHALVDEFVSNLSSECDSLANNVSAEAHMYVAHESAVAGSQTKKPSNRSTSEVLNGLRRPSSTPLTSSYTREGKSEVQHVKPTLQAGNNRNREEARDLLAKKDMRAKGVALKGLDDVKRVMVVDTDIDDILLRDLEVLGSSRTHMGAKGRPPQAVEVLSSDSGLSHSPRPRAKHSGRRPRTQPGTPRTQPGTKGRDSTSQGRSKRMETRSPSNSPERSHSTDYSYDDDTPSLGGRSPHGDTPFLKLRWPSDLGGSGEDGGIGQKSDNNDAVCNTEYQPKHERKKADVDMSLDEGDESNGEDSGHNPIQTDSDGEEMPVLPKVPVKRKVTNQPRVSERRTQRGSAKSASPQTKRQRTPQIDASVITQLEFGKRPENCVSIRRSWLSLSCIVQLIPIKLMLADPPRTCISGSRYNCVF